MCLKIPQNFNTMIGLYFLAYLQIARIGVPETSQVSSTPKIPKRWTMFIRILILHWMINLQCQENYIQNCSDEQLNHKFSELDSSFVNVHLGPGQLTSGTENLIRSDIKTSPLSVSGSQRKSHQVWHWVNHIIIILHFPSLFQL